MSTLPDKGYFTTGINTDIPWPIKEVAIDFCGHKFHLLPETESASRMVRVETSAGFTCSDAYKLVLEFLSALAWAEQYGVVPTFGNWSTAPLAVGNGPMGCVFDGIFHYFPDPPDTKAKLALALYREGLSVNLIPYKVLGFFKVINIICDKGPAQIQWIKDHLQYVTDREAVTRIAMLQNTEPRTWRSIYMCPQDALSHMPSTKIVL